MPIDEFKRKLKEDLEKSGFGAEMLAIQAILSAKGGWTCNGSPSYYDRDSEQSREYDLRAFLPLVNRPKNGPHQSVSQDIAAEVKKIDKPWIVFKHKPRQDKMEHIQAGWSDILHYRWNLPDVGALMKILERTSLSHRNGWTGYGIHESFKKPDRPSRWYSAFVTACKAAEHITAEESGKSSQGSKEFIPNESSRLYICKPTVIVDGPLFSAELTEEGEVELNEINSATVDFHFRTQHYNATSYKVAVVKLDELQSFVKLCEERQSLLLESIVESAQAKG